MIERVMFSDPWYPKYIVQTLRDSEASADALAVADSIMVAGAFVAQSIDHAFGGDSGKAGLTEEVSSLAAAMSDIAGAMREIAASIEASKS